MVARPQSFAIVRLFLLILYTFGANGSMDRFRIPRSVSIACLLLNCFVTGATITSTATTTITTFPSDFIGYYTSKVSGSISDVPLKCNRGESFTTSGRYARCCPTRDSAGCAMPTECKNGLMAFDNNIKTTCSNCATVAIYEYFDVPTSMKQILCQVTSQSWTLYRYIQVRTATPTGIPSEPHATISTTSQGLLYTNQFSNLSTTSITSQAMPTAPLAPIISQTTTWITGELSRKPHEKQNTEAAKISGIIVGTILFISIIILGLLLGRSKWNKPPSLPLPGKVHEAEGSNGPALVPTRRQTSRQGPQRTYMSREGFNSVEELSHSGRFSPAQELPTVVEERYQQISAASSPISPCVSSPR
ncbi:hypothetical protein PAAG_07599 [Paracoccidioides lutzii Pb01]|uniref:Uncharacterized protein n=1 Tax=Paracoccidioides lutzii (strain ATCC MYA-826 / Pb01) TaxID=502779 RepID=C1HAE5_PARBA|nr:hypothetical protein PAAG_07599 [Paracoccidioides lutzii Pb01]EEH37318.2 hypothetical protein PAAG_07599 [Paracoccidioides lutzii Pb01]